MFRIPQELIDFFSLGSGTLLIKGDPGTGKTILSLELLRRFGVDKSGVYLSTRVSPERLFTQFPWLRDVVEPERILDASSRNRGGASKDERFVVSDARLGHFPTTFEHLYELAMELDNPFLVIDSWDAALYRFDPEERVNVMSLLETLIASKKANIVFVSEKSERTTLDYLVDGVVTLSERRVENRPVREITLNKLRGVQRSSDRYLFTLLDGRFQSFRARKTYLPAILQKRPPIEDPDKNRISSGIHDLDELLGGGYERGSFNVIEQGIGIGDLHDMVLVPTILNHLNLGRGLVISMAEGHSTEIVEQHNIPFLSKEDRFRKQVISFERFPPENNPRVKPLSVDAVETLEEMVSAQKTLEKTYGRPVLTFLGLDTLEHTFGYNKFDPLSNMVGQMVSMAKATGNVVIAHASE
ncbi:MAG: ATPase domain-containing protein, partial [Candidatus Geothermarchaeales archaeon]